MPAQQVFIRNFRKKVKTFSWRAPDRTSWRRSGRACQRPLPCRRGACPTPGGLKISSSDRTYRSVSIQCRSPQLVRFNPATSTPDLEAGAAEPSQDSRREVPVLQKPDLKSLSIGPQNLDEPEARQEPSPATRRPSADMASAGLLKVWAGERSRPGWAPATFRIPPPFQHSGSAGASPIVLGCLANPGGYAHGGVAGRRRGDRRRPLLGQLFN